MKLNPASPLAFSNRSFARGVLEQLKQGLADCRESLRIKPGNPGAFGSRALIYLKLRRYDAAIADFDRILRKGHDDSYALFGRGLAKHLRGDLRGGGGDMVARQAARPAIAGLRNAKHLPG